MTVSSFGIEKEFLKDLLDEAHMGRLQLPEFQRGWVWPHTHISSLVASISNGYPVGTLMLLRTGGSVRFKVRPIEGAPASQLSPERLILDGQQRITSLYQALHRNCPVETADGRKNPASGWFYIDMDAAVADPGSREEAIHFVPRDRIRRNFRGQVILDLSSPALEYKAGMFPLNRVFDPNPWMFGYLQQDPEAMQAAMDRWQAFQVAAITPFTKYQLPVIDLGRDTSREAVVQVFEKVNTGGVTLTVFELLTASFAADQFDLRADWKQRRNAWSSDRHKVLREVANTDFLQAVTLLATGDGRANAALRIGARRSDVLNLTLDQYRRWAPEVERGLVAASKFLHEMGIYETKFLPYGSQLIPLAAILATLGKDAETAPSRAKLRRWYWSGVFGELYGGATETRFAHDLPDVVAWVRGAQAEEPRTVQEAQFFASRLWSLRSRQSAAYKGIYVLLLARGIADWRSGQAMSEQHYFDENVDIHHVFPQSWCEKQGIDRGRFNSILNKTPLAARTNRIIGGSAPSEYLRRLARSAGTSVEAIQGLVAPHLFEVQLLAADDFDASMDYREDQLLSMIADAMGKPTQDG